MDFNGRMSSAARGSSTKNQRGRQPEPEEDMTLDDRDIVACLNEIGIAFTLQDLHKPQPQIVQKSFEVFADLFMNTNRDVVAPAMRAAAEDMYGPDADRVFTPDTRDLMGFFVMMRKLLVECGINDFTFQDLYKPTRERIVKLFSYIINFLRFRESLTDIMKEAFEKPERTKLRIEQLYHDNQAKRDLLHELERNRKHTEAALRDKERRNSELKQRLLDLRKVQERVGEKLNEVKAEQTRLKEILEEKTAQTMQVKQECAKIRPYTQQSSAALETALRDLNSTLSQEKAQIDYMDRRARALQTSADTFGVVAADVQGCTRLLGDVQADLAKEEEELAKAARHRDALSERSNNVRDVERQEKLLQRQLASINGRTEKLRANADEKAELARQRMEELKGVHKKLTEERQEKGKDIERRRVKIEQTEKKMADLKENIENEVHAAREEYLKMESHIKLYITEMEKSIY